MSDAYRRVGVAVGRGYAMFDYLIVGAGFAGCTVAERLASQLGKRVLLVDKRNHIGGNAYDRYNEAGILVHQYGPHIFHTNSERVFAYLSQFTAWRPYQHRVLSYVDGQLVPFPVNLDTVNMLYGLNITTDRLAEFYQRVREPLDVIRTAEDQVVSQVGKDLYEKLFRGYTRKQWGLDPSQLDASVTRRVPVRMSRDPRYFSDRYQGIPRHGYSDLFTKMIAHPKISIVLNADYRSVVHEFKFDRLVYTGPIDEFFDYKHGRLPYRSLQFEFETLPMETFQSVGTVNYPNDYDFTRITEFKHLTGQQHLYTTIVREYPKPDGDPYYPVPTEDSQEIYRKYEREAQKLNSVWFVGRLANYRYYNMDQVVEAGLKLVEHVTDN